MESIDIALVATGALLVALRFLSGVTRPAQPPVPLIALCVGVLLGPIGFGVLLAPGQLVPTNVLEQIARLTVAVGLTEVALRLPAGSIQRQWRALLVMLGLILPFAWIVGGAIVFAGYGVSLSAAMLTGAVLAPTDPVVAGSIVSSPLAEQKLAAPVRQLLSTESGFNDGLGYPFLVLPILLLQHPPEQALTTWITHVVLWEVVAAAALGGVIGFVVGQGWRRAEAAHEMHPTAVIAIALAFMVMGSTKLLAMDGVLAAFVAALAFKYTVWGMEEQVGQIQQLQESLSELTIAPFFLLLGLVLPWQAWAGLGWEGVIIAILVLIVRRLPAVIMARPWLGGCGTWRNALFLGWFGPVGVAAVFYAMLTERRTGLTEPWAIASLVIVVSLVLHGLTAAPLTYLYGQLDRHQ